MLAAAALAFGLLAFAPAALASTNELCDQAYGCWINKGYGHNIGVAQPGQGSAFARYDTGGTWQGHDLFELKTGAGDCAEDGGIGAHLTVERGCTGGNDELYYFPGGEITGVIVSIGTSIQEGGEHYCLIDESPGGSVGNQRCPSSDPLSNMIFQFKSY